MKLLKLEKVHHGKYLKSYELTYENKSGREKKYEIVSRRELNDITEIGKYTSGVSIVATMGDKMLLLREFRMGVGRFIYNLCAGMIEQDESLEECISRELYEETGLHVKNISYFGSQPWPHSGSLLFGFYCDLDGDNHITLQESELSVGTWIERSSLPVQPNTLSLTSTLMESFRNGAI